MLKFCLHSKATPIVAICLISIFFGHAVFANTLVFGGDANYPPFEWAENGTSRGFHVELGAAIASSDGMTAVHKLSDWPEAVEALKAGEIDILPMLASDERGEEFAFSRPFHFMAHGVYGRRSAQPIGDLADLSGSSVVVERLSYAAQRLAIEYPGFRVVSVANTLEALRLVDQGAADYALVALPVANYLVESQNFKLARSGPPIWIARYVFAVRKENQQLADWLSVNFEAILKNGKFDEVYASWKPLIEPGGNGSLPSYVRYAAALGMFFLFVGALSIWGLRRAVSHKTERLRREFDKRKLAEERADHLTIYDELSGLPKLTQFIASTETLLLEGDGTGKFVIVFKISDFKQIVLSFGYAVAEKMFADFGRSLSSMQLPAVGHLGRATFAAIADEQQQHRLCSSDGIMLKAADIVFQPTLICGIAPIAQGVSASDLVRRAETALAAAVTKKLPRLIYSKDLDPSWRDAHLMAEFRAGAARSMYCVFQPQLDLRTGRIVGVEALARWSSPTLGDVEPSHFIPLLEDAGLITEFTKLVIDQVVRALCQLREFEIELDVSVNVSVRDFQGFKVAEYIRQQCNDNPELYRRIKVELTETALADSPQRIKEELLALNFLGIATSIDDFGTGYSSLNYLRQLSIQEVKIDRTFTKDILTDSTTLEIVNSLITLSHNLNVSVVAEGVESAGQLDTLMIMRCDRIQGFYLSKPLRLKELISFVSDYSKDADVIRCTEIGVE